MTRSKLATIDAQRICVIKPSALGDVAQSLPLLGPLRSRFPESEIVWVINRGLSGLLAGHPDLQRTIPFDRHGGLAATWRLMRGLRDGRFDLTIDLQGLLRTGAMTLATGAAFRIGLETAREGAGMACNFTIPNTGRDVAAHARYWKVAEAFGVGEQPRQLRLAIDDQQRATASRLLGNLPRPIIGLHAGARWETKRWPVESFAEVARAAIKQHSGSIALLGSPDERELTEQLESLIGGERESKGRVVNLTGQTSLKELAAVLNAIDLLVSNDSGPMHLAAELGTPVVGVFTCTDPVLSGPPGDAHALVATGVDCAASYQKTCPHSGAGRHACFAELTPSRVIAAVDAQILRHNLRVRSA